MKHILPIGSVLILSALSIFAQSPVNPPKSPSDIVAQFVQFEVNGGRLTTDGWHKADKFFVHPVPQPQNEKIFVIYDDYSVWKDLARIKGNTAMVTVGTLPVGDIDSEFHFKPSKYYKGYWIYNLLLADTHWEPDLNGGTIEVKGRPEWRINDSDPNMNLTVLTLTLTTAIRYVTEMRDKSTDPVIKKNADETLTILKRSK